MSREESATIYLDALLGFRGTYDQYRQATDALSEADTNLLRNAVSETSGKNDGAKRSTFFWCSN